MLFNGMILTETLFPHLWEVQQTFEERMELLMAKLLAKHPAPDKAVQQLAWVAHMVSLFSVDSQHLIVFLTIQEL